MFMYNPPTDSNVVTTHDHRNMSYRRGQIVLTPLVIQEKEAHHTNANINPIISS